jgi:hypothetical protein
VATFWVDQDGVGGTVGSDSTWTVAARAGDATKPFKTPGEALKQVIAANPGGGDIIEWRKRSGTARYDNFTVTGLKPTTQTILRGYQPTTGPRERPANNGFVLDKCEHITVEHYLSYNFQRVQSGRYINLLLQQGRSLVPGGSTTTGTLFCSGVNDCIFDVDILYSGTTDKTLLTGAVVGINFDAPNSNEQSRVTITGKIEGCGDSINGPAVYSQDWVFGGNKPLELHRTTQFTYHRTNDPPGVYKTDHADAIQWEGDSDNITFYDMRVFEGSGRLMIMPSQGSGGVVNPNWMDSHHRGMRVEICQWANLSDLALMLYCTPGIKLLGNTVWAPNAPTDTRVRITHKQNSLQPDIAGTTGVIMKGNKFPGIRVTDNGGTVTFADKRFNHWPHATSGITNYVKSPQDTVGTFAFVKSTSDIKSGDYPNLRLAAGDAGIDAGPASGDTSGLTNYPIKDADGNTRTGTRDLGAYEKGSTSTGPFTIAIGQITEADLPRPVTVQGGSGSTGGTVTSIEAQGRARVTVYPPSAQTGNQFNEFCGAMVMADGSIVCAFVRAVSPVPPFATPSSLPTSSNKAPQIVYDRLGHDRTSWSPTRDFWSLDNSIHYRRSTDGGATWSDYRVDDTDIYAVSGQGSHLFHPSGVYPQAHVVCPNGDWLRRINREDLKYADAYWNNSTAAAVCERLTGDKTSATWVNAGTGNNLWFGTDPTVGTVQISRMKVISGDRIMACGEYWPVTAGTRTSRANQQPYIAISSDNGATWTPALASVPTGSNLFYPNEGDFAELTDGSILMVWRSGTIPWVASPPGTNTSSQYNQVLLTPTGTGTYTWGTPKKADFSTTTSPIHPLLVVEKTSGAVMFFSRGPEGAWYTLDGGAHWTQLAFTSPTVAGFSTGYYPNGVQGPDGKVYVFSHTPGDDDEYGENDQTIVVDKFSIAITGSTGASGVLIGEAESTGIAQPVTVIGGDTGPVESGVTGEVLPASAFSNPAFAGEVWQNPHYVTGVEGNSAGVVLSTGLNALGVSQRLDCDEFPLDLPDESRAQGFTVRLRKRQTVATGQVTDYLVQLQHSGVLLGQPRSLGGTWPGTLGYFAYGSATDTWGLTQDQLRSDFLNDPGFGVAVIARNNSPSASSAQIERVTMNVAWEQAAPLSVDIQEAFEDETARRVTILGGSTLGLKTPIGIASEVDAAEPSTTTTTAPVARPANFSDVAARMLGELPPFTAENREVQIALDAIGRELERIDVAAAALRNNFFPQYGADPLLGVWESVLGLSAADKTVAQRRTSILAYLQGIKSGGFGSSWVQQLLALAKTKDHFEYTGDEGSPPPYTVSVPLPPEEGQDAAYEKEKAARVITPAHLDLIFSTGGGFILGQSRIGQVPL